MMENTSHNNEDHRDKEHNTSSWRWGRIVGVVLLVLLGIGISIQLLFNIWAEPMLKDKLESAANSQHLTTDSGDWSISLLSRQFMINDLTVYQPDTSSLSPGSSSQPLDSLTIGEISISGIHVFSYLFSNELKMNSVVIDRPQVLGRHPDSFSSGSGSSETKGSDSSDQAGSASDTSSGGTESQSLDSTGGGQQSSQTLYDRIRSFVNAVEIEEFTIREFYAELDDDTTARNQAAIHNLNLEFENIRIDSTAPQRRWMPASVVSGSIDSLHWQTPAGLYEFRSDSMGFSSRDSLFSIRNFSVHPLLPKYDFSMEKGQETDRIDLDIQSFDVRDLDLISLLEHQQVQASTIQVRNSDLEVFHSMKPPAGPTEEKPFPHLQFRKLDVPVAVDSVVLSNVNIAYGEHKNMVPEPGVVSFEKTEGVIRNLYNEASSQSPKPITADVRSNVMGVGNIKVSFNFPPNASGAHYINGSVGSMPITSLNPVLKYLAKMEVQKGYLDSISFKMELGAQSSTGNLKMQYRDFTIDVIQFGDRGEQQSAKIKSFLAGLVVDEGSSPTVQEGNVSFERIKNKGIFNYWWKSLLSGLKSSIAF